MAQLNDNHTRRAQRLRMLFAIASALFLFFGSVPAWAMPPPCAGASGAVMPALEMSLQGYTISGAQPAHPPQLPADDPCCHGGLVCAACAGAPLGGIPIAVRVELPVAKVGIVYLPRSLMVPHGFSTRPNLPPPRVWA